MKHEEFVVEWSNRYLKGCCTLEHLERLVNIGRLSDEELRSILLKERMSKKGV